MYLTKQNLQIKSFLISRSHALQVKYIQEGLGSIRDIILDKSHYLFLENYQKADKSRRLAEADINFFSFFPKYILEASVLVLFAFLSSFLAQRNNLGFNIVPILGTLALGLQKLLPSMQQMYSSWSKMRGYYNSVNNVLSTLKPFRKPAFNKVLKPLEFNSQIMFKNISYGYSKNNYF